MINEHRQLNRLFVLFDIIITILSFLFAWYIIIVVRATDDVGVLSFNIYMTSLVFIVPILLITNSIFGLYKSVRTEDAFIEFPRIIESNLIALLIFNSILFIFNKHPIIYNYSRLLIITFSITNIVFEIIFRNIAKYALRNIRKKGFNQKHILLVGYSDAAFKFIDRVNRNPGWGYNIHGIVDDLHKLGTVYRNVKIIGNLSDLENIISDNTFDEIAVTLSLNEYDKLRNIVSVCEKSGVHTKFVPDYGTIISTKPESDDLDGLPVINIRAVPLQGLLNRFVKRTVDIIGSIFGLILFSPVMLIIAIIIKTTSKGPVVFKQKRVGRHNKLFTMYKFRSMKVQTDDDEKKRWTTANDDRVTKIGKIIRRISFDELPQFYNVLKGDMSLVGPRPERLQFVEKFKESIPRYMIKHQVRPGITGWAQINGLRGDTSIDRRIQYDLWYIENWTIWLDIKILFLTLIKGFINENAY